jgi:hypothetical protein
LQHGGILPPKLRASNASFDIKPQKNENWIGLNGEIDVE